MGSPLSRSVSFCPAVCSIEPISSDRSVCMTWQERRLIPTNAVARGGSLWMQEPRHTRSGWPQPQIPTSPANWSKTGHRARHRTETRRALEQWCESGREFARGVARMFVGSKPTTMRFTFERRCRRSAPAERACQRMRLSNPLLELPGHGLLTSGPVEHHIKATGSKRITVE